MAIIELQNKETMKLVSCAHWTFFCNSHLKGRRRHQPDNWSLRGKWHPMRNLTYPATQNKSTKVHTRAHLVSV